MGYIGVEELGGRYHPAHKGRGDLGEKQKNEPPGLGLGQCSVGGLCVR
jgi:hypothetical protein